ncbi:MAG TPA: hypothetical protein VGM03_05180, partial [Phycisphaerae bacterium]
MVEHLRAYQPEQVIADLRARGLRRCDPPDWESGFTWFHKPAPWYARLPFARLSAKTVAIVRVSEPTPLEVLELTQRAFEAADTCLVGNAASFELRPVLYG